jgi:type VI secretion system protein ImpC
VPGTGAGFAFDETVRGPSDFVWMNASWLLAGTVARAFSCSGWPVNICGKEAGALEGLPRFAERGTSGEELSIGPLDVALWERRESELAQLGFVTLATVSKAEGRVAFLGASTCARYRRFDDDALSKTYFLASQLPYRLALARFAHYLMMIYSDRIGTLPSRAGLEVFLNLWISEYVLDQEAATEPAKAERPLRAAHIELTDDGARPGHYKAVVHLRPHFQLEEPPRAMRIVFELP